ncbi:MAG: hypothetical protein WCJ33_03805, partial [Pseudomonadota bacterium]
RCKAVRDSRASGASNGNGDGQIGATTESFQFWYQLASAKLIEGSYTGVTGAVAGGKDSVIGTNCPETKLKGTGFAINFLGIISGGSDTAFFDGNYGHVLYYGAYQSGLQPLSAAITASEAYNIDKKIDDGLPVSGNILAQKTTGWTTSCTTGTTSAATYVASSASTKRCALIIVTGF